MRGTRPRDRLILRDSPKPVDLKHLAQSVETAVMLKRRES